jgi:hypothetical protein
LTIVVRGGEVGEEKKEEMEEEGSVLVGWDWGKCKGKRLEGAQEGGTRCKACSVAIEASAARRRRAVAGMPVGCRR